MSSLSEEVRALAKREFEKRADQRGALSLFECRCLLRSVYGVDKSTRTLSEVWLSLPSPSNAQLSDEEVMARGIDRDTLEAIAHAVLRAEGIAETTLANRIYEVFDQKHRGFVSPSDLERVLVSSGRTHLARNRAPQLFALLDELGIEKISSTQLKSALFRT